MQNEECRIKSLSFLIPHSSFQYVHHTRRPRRLWQDITHPPSRGVSARDGACRFPTREPGGTSISEQIRDILHDLKNTEMHPRTETLLYQAARAQIVEQVIKPRLAAGEIVISDRYYDSTIAYQGYGHQQDLDQVRGLVKYATGGLTPDLTILLDLDVEVGLKRKKQNESEWNRMDDHEVKFYERVRAGYLELVKQEPQRWVIVNSDQKWDDVQAELKKVIVERLQVAG